MEGPAPHPFPADSLFQLSLLSEEGSRFRRSILIHPLRHWLVQMKAITMDA